MAHLIYFKCTFSLIVTRKSGCMKASSVLRISNKVQLHVDLKLMARFGISCTANVSKHFQHFPLCVSFVMSVDRFDGQPIQSKSIIICCCSPPFRVCFENFWSPKQVWLFFWHVLKQNRGRFSNLTRIHNSIFEMCNKVLCYVAICKTKSFNLTKTHLFPNFALLSLH